MREGSNHWVVIRALAAAAAAAAVVVVVVVVVTAVTAAGVLSMLCMLLAFAASVTHTMMQGRGHMLRGRNTIVAQRRYVHVHMWTVTPAALLLGVGTAGVHSEEAFIDEGRAG